MNNISLLCYINNANRFKSFSWFSKLMWELVISSLQNQLQKKIYLQSYKEMIPHEPESAKSKSEDNLSLEQNNQNTYPTQTKYSNLKEEYVNFMKNIPVVKKEQLVNTLRINYILYSEDSRAEKIEIKVSSSINNFEVLQVQVSYAHFKGKLNIFCVQTQSKIHTFCKSQSGGYGRIYKISHKGKVFALKCLTYSPDNFQSIFKNVVIEYFILKIASILEVGPSLQPPFGFDIIIYSNCIQFTMQLCQYSSTNFLENDLKISLSKLHSLKIIHLDIKPENINFSQFYNKFIFIDFGLSKLINEEIGEKTQTLFRGSLIYCSSEMESLYFQKQSNFVDLYYNDAECLKKTLIYFDQMNQYYDIDSDPNHEQIDMTSEYELTSLKWELYRFCNDPKKYQHSFNELQQSAIEKYFVQLSDFISFLPSPELLHTKFYYNFWSKYNREQERKSRLFSQLHEEEILSRQVNEIFAYRFSQIRTINDLPHLSYANLYNNIELEKKILLQFQKYSFVPKEIYYLKLVQFIRVDENDTPSDLKTSIALKFVNSEIAVKTLIQCPIKAALEFILDYFMNSPISKYSIPVIQSMVISLMFFEAKDQGQMIQLLDSLLRLQCRIVDKFKIVLKFIMSIKWIQTKIYTIYEYEKLQQQIFTISKNFLQNIQVKILNPIEKTLYTISSKIIEQQLKSSSPEKIRNILTEIKFENILMINVNLLKELFRYINLRELQLHISQNLPIYSNLLSECYKLATEWQKRCSISICLFTELHLIDYQLKKDKLFKYYFRSFSKIEENYRQITHYKIFIYYKFHQLLMNSIEEKEFLDIFKIFFNKCSFQNKILFFAELLKVYIHRHMDNNNNLIDISVLDFIAENAQCIVSVPSQISPSLIHKHRIVYLIKNVVVVFHFLINYYTFTMEIKDMIANFSENMMNLIRSEQCLTCKVLSLTELHFLQSYIYTIDGKFQQILYLYIDLMLYMIKNQGMINSTLIFLNIMIIFTRNTNQIEVSHNIITLFSELIIKQKYYLFYFYCGLDGDQRLSETYLYLLRNDKIEKLITLLQVLLLFMLKNSAKSYIICFFNAIYGLKNKFNNSERQLFYDKHRTIITHFKKKEFNPIVGLFFSILLHFNSRKGSRSHMLHIIAKSINFLSYFCKCIILNSYYQCFLMHQNITGRRQIFLKKQHAKYVFLTKLKYSQFHKLLSLKKLDQERIVLKKISDCLKRYFENIHQTPIRQILIQPPKQEIIGL